MASNNGYLTHCRICGTPIFSLGNRQCGSQNEKRTGKARGGKNESI